MIEPKVARLETLAFKMLIASTTTNHRRHQRSTMDVIRRPLLIPKQFLSENKRERKVTAKVTRRQRQKKEESKLATQATPTR